VMGDGLRAYATDALPDGDALTWKASPTSSADLDIVRPIAKPFSADGGLKLLDGPLGRAVIKVSAVQPKHRIVEAPAIVFDSQDALLDRFHAGELDRDFIAVLRFQGPRANGMPELHKLTPALGSLQDRGFMVALVTDGRMSGASGKVPAAIHLSPEAALGGALARVLDGDRIRLDAEIGVLDIMVDGFDHRPLAPAPAAVQTGMGRELFSGFRKLAGPAEEGALSIPDLVNASADDPALIPA